MSNVLDDTKQQQIRALGRPRELIVVGSTASIGLVFALNREHPLCDGVDRTSSGRNTQLMQIFDLFGEDNWRNVHAGELEVRPLLDRDSGVQLLIALSLFFGRRPMVPARSLGRFSSIRAAIVEERANDDEFPVVKSA